VQYPTGLIHADLRVQPAYDSIETTAQLHVVQCLVLFPDRILGVDLGALQVALLNGFLCMLGWLGAVIGP
jgi:hypothetical protein